MNTLELKGGMIEMIAQVKDKELLQHLYEIMSEVLIQTLSDKTQLSPAQEAKLALDIKASKDPKNLVDHQIVLKKMSRWLKK